MLIPIQQGTAMMRNLQEEQQLRGKLSKTIDLVNGLLGLAFVYALVYGVNQAYKFVFN
jgi:hypothetical protein